MMRSMLAGMAMLLAACGGETAGPEAQAPARPALWCVADADTTIYLFGSIHMLPPGATWRSDVVDKAMASAGTVYFEADVLGDPDGMRGLVERLGRLPPPETLSGSLAAEQSSTLGAVAARLGISRPALETMRPWYAAVVLSDAAIRAAGFGSDAGVDAELRQGAEASGKQVRFLETVERQLSALADLPGDVQLAYLDFTLAEAGNVMEPLSQMVNAWRGGDVETLARVLIDEDMARLPALEDALLIRRNAEWTGQFDQLLGTEAGTFFVTVGAAHLVGDNSVVTGLSARGHTVERLQ
jgi:uncharacterized protein YbaP (TraB family)